MKLEVRITRHEISISMIKYGHLPADRRFHRYVPDENRVSFGNRNER